MNNLYIDNYFIRLLMNTYIKNIIKFSPCIFSLYGFTCGLRYGLLNIKEYEHNKLSQIPAYNKIGYAFGCAWIGALAGAWYPITIPALVYKSYTETEALEKKSIEAEKKSIESE